MTYAKIPSAGGTAPDAQPFSPFMPDVSSLGMGVMGSYAVPGQYAYSPLVTNSVPAQLPVSYDSSMAGDDYYALPPGYKLVPLGNDEQRRGMSTGAKIAVAVVVALLIAAIYYVAKKSKEQKEKPSLTPAQAIKKLPTSRLAQNLYKRLEKNGSTSKSVLNALDKIAQEQ